MAKLQYRTISKRTVPADPWSAKLKFHPTLDAETREMLTDVLEATGYQRELRESPPRARIVMAVSRFEEFLSKKVLDELMIGTMGQKDGKLVKGMAPRSITGWILLAYAMGILTFEMVADLQKVRDLRNRAVHKTRFLLPTEEREIERAILYLQFLETWMHQGDYTKLLIRYDQITDNLVVNRRKHFEGLKKRAERPWPAPDILLGGA